MDTIKVVGTREEVYKCHAQKTIGGLTKIDIIEKCNNGNVYLDVDEIIIECWVGLARPPCARLGARIALRGRPMPIL